MKLALNLAVTACFLLATAPSLAGPARQPKSGPESLNTAIDSILSPTKLKDLKVGIAVASVGTGEVIYTRAANELMMPASVAKVFTAYSALKKLKPTFTFKTQVLTTGPTMDGKLGGDIYIRGGGDPSLVSERMWMLVNDLTRSGIKTVTGNIVVDSSFFDTEKTPDSRPKYLKDQAYNAPVGAFSFNFNTTTIYVAASEEPGKPPKVYTDPANSYIDIVNQAVTGKAGAKNTIQVSRTTYVKGDVGDTVLLRGTIPLDSKELRFYRNIVNPALYAGHMFRRFMEERGMKVIGNVVEGTVPGHAKQILEFESQPLWHVIWGMNKFSNNFTADQVLKRLGAEMWGPPGTLQKGVAALQDVMEDIGIKKGTYEFVDGSGLTRNTRVSPRMVLDVLLAAYRDFSMAPEFISSLGISGEDGTLRNRLPSNSTLGTVRAKTGTLDGVSSLAGYVNSKDNELLAFAIILNDPQVKYGRMAGWVDQVARAIAKFSRNE